MSTLTVERMVVEVQGDGEPAILVHGLGGTSNAFEPQMDVLRGCRVIRPDLLGSGRANNPAAAAFVRESLMRQCPNGYAMTCEALANARAADARRISCPTLIVNGDEDPVAPASMARGLGDQIERSEVAILSRCGHWPTVEQPKEVNEVLKRFYARQPR